MLRRSLFDDDEPPKQPESDLDLTQLLGMVAGVFRFHSDGPKKWCARIYGSNTHGFGDTPRAAMEAALTASKSQSRVRRYIE